MQYEQINVTITDNRRMYPIITGIDVLTRMPYLLDTYIKANKYLLVTNKTVAKFYSIDFRYIPNMNMCIMPDGEKYKNLSQVNFIYECAIKSKLDRYDAIIALGGGVVGDIAGYAAATYLRGIKYVQVPTTILAQVDASVGGKVAVNLPEGKNLVGAFYQPTAVFQDVCTLKTLDNRQIKSGLAEVLKYAFIQKTAAPKSVNMIDFLQKNRDKILSLEFDITKYMVTNCCLIKKNVVENDERETGLRAVLNFGHTFAHPIESLTKYKFYSHGEAVAIGMKMAFDLALNRNLITEDYYNDSINLIDSYGLKYNFPSINIDKFIDVMHTDKKVSADKIKFVLPNAPKQVDFYTDVTDDEIRTVLKKYAHKN